MIASRSFLLAALLCCLGVWMNVVSVAEAGYNPNSFPMLLANPQHNGLVANATALDNSTITVAWEFTEPDQDEFRDAPVYSADENAVYVASYTGFIYSVDADTGKQIWESCIGTPPKFPGDPCDHSGIDSNADYPFGQPTLLSTGNLIILRSAEGKYNESMVCLDKNTGSIVWTFDLREYYHFYSSPTPIPQPSGGDAILVWVSSYDAMTYTVINGTTGAVVAENQYPNMASDEMVATMSLDPADGNVITQWIDITNGCGDDYPQFMGCTGIGKLETLTGNHIWNSSMEDSWTNGMIALDPVRDAIYVTGNQMDAYAYKLDTGAPLWKASQVVFATADMGWPSVCADGTVIIVDVSGEINGFDPTPERVMHTKWAISFNPPLSKAVTTLPDNTFIYTVGNAVFAANCTDATTLWVQDFGDSDNGEGNMVAVAPSGVFANVYWPGKQTGMLVRITDARSK